VSTDVALRGFWLAAEADPDRVALIDPSGKEWTAGALLAGANQLVHGLRARGLQTGDRVATVLPNGPELIQVLLAVFQGGWHYTAINTHLTPSEVDYILNDAQMSAVFGDVEGSVSFDEVVDGQPTVLPSDRVAGQFLQYTSGTTGRPKAVLRSLPILDPETWVRMYSPNLTRYDIVPGGDGVHLVTSPMYHLAPLSFGLLSLHFEHTVVLMDRWDAETALALIEQHGVTSTHMVPTQFHRLLLLDEDVRSKYDVSSLRNVMHAAAPCPIDTKRRMLEWFGPVIYEYYGASEGGGTFARAQEWLAHPGTVGRPWDGADVRILDDDGKDVPPGTIGTVYLKLLGDFEYKDDPDKTSANRVGGYFTVGDVGELDDEGYLYLRDRKIDMIISGGVNIYPAEVEAALLSHPAVGDAAVFGIPHDDWGEEVKAVVELASGWEPNEDVLGQLRDHCAGALADYKRPRSIDIIDALPRDPNGKLYKRRLRDPYWAGRETRI
jgi:long-chain acyl-CoA synthetase